MPLLITPPFPSLRQGGNLYLPGYPALCRRTPLYEWRVLKRIIGLLQKRLSMARLQE